MRPIFIIGITGRSGTNFLRDILSSHSDISKTRLKGEDYFISKLDYLDLYLNNVTFWWKRKKWEYQQYIEDEIKIAIGKGLMSIMPEDKSKKAFVLKTPETTNVHKYKEYFPDGKVVVIIRDAKDMVESGVKSKFWNYEEGFEIWNKSAKRIVKIKNRKDIFFTTYEKLVLNTEKELSKIIEFCELDTKNYPFSNLKKTPVFGSSANKKEGDEWNWKTQKKDESFKPLSRSAHWGVIRRWRYNWKCGKNAILLGYKKEKIKFLPLYFIVNFSLDIVLSIFKLKLFMKELYIKYLCRIK